MSESHGSLSNFQPFFLFSIFKNYSFLIKNLILVTFYPFNIFKMQFCFLWNANYQDELLVKLWFLSLFLYGFRVVMYCLWNSCLKWCVRNMEDEWIWQKHTTKLSQLQWESISRETVWLPAWSIATISCCWELKQYPLVVLVSEMYTT